MIIWLASYPKSGNTWVRAIIASLLFTEDGKFNFEYLKRIPQFPQKRFFEDIVNNLQEFEEIKKNWILAQNRINLTKSLKFLKTHNGNYTLDNFHFTNKVNTLGTIYIVRDPRNVLLSIKNHYDLNDQKALDFILTSKKLVHKDKTRTLLGKWGDHYKSWTRNNSNLLIIKYENLINNPEYELIKIIKYLEKNCRFETNEEKNKNIIKTTSFQNLKKMESEGKFKESVLSKELNKITFFNQGKENCWEKKLDKKVRREIEKMYYEEMKELGYLI